MDVHGPAPLGGPSPVSQPRPAQPQEIGSSKPPSQPSDEVEISEMGRLLDDLSRNPEIRQDRVDAVRQAIEAGTYETPEKIEMAVQRLLDELQGDA